MMDDTQDKVRRNLVVFSAAIVLGWFLDIKLTNIVAKLFVTDVTHVNAGRFWMAILIVLVYLFLRYHFDDKTKSQVKHLSEELWQQRKSYVHKYLSQKLAWINRTGKFHPVFGKSLSESVTKRMEQYENEGHKLSFRLYMASSPEFGSVHTVLQGAVKIGEEYRKLGSSHSLHSIIGPQYDFSIPSTGRVWIYFHTLTHVMVYSKSAVDLLVPMGLFFVALFITISKLISICFI